MKTIKRVKAASLALAIVGMGFLAAGLRAGEIHDAAAAGDLNKVKALLEADPKLLESKTAYGETPLMSACLKTQIAVADFLIDKGANVNARNVYGVPVLNDAITEGEECIRLVQRLIDKGAEINVKNSDGGSPLHRAAMVDNLRVAKLLIDRGADLNAPSRQGTPLQRIILSGLHEKTAVFLVENGATPQVYNFGNNDLHLAAMKGLADLVQVMVRHGADINAVNEYGRTPLYYAARHGHRRAAEVLVAAGADKRAIVETNYGKAPQLTATLREGEVHLWYLGGPAPGTGYAVKTKNNLLVFDPPRTEESPEASLANGAINPTELAGQKSTVLLTRKERYPIAPTVREIAQRLPGAGFVLSFDPNDGGGGGLPSYRQAKAHENFSMGDMQVHTIQTPPNTLSSTGNLGYLVEVDGVKVLHAGLLRAENKAAQIEAYRREVDFLKPFGPIDLAILPVGWHHLGPIDYKSYLYLIDELSPKAIYLIGDDLISDEHRQCLEALKARSVPVYYPDGGVALGQRFHYLAPAAHDFTGLYGDYLGQNPPGDTPVVFARDIVSTDDLEHSPAVFSPDGNEVYWFTARPPGPNDKDWLNRAMTMRRIGNRWTLPRVSPFNGPLMFSPDGRRGYFWSHDDKDIFVIERQDDDWSEPKGLKFMTKYPELGFAVDPSSAANGTLYFLCIAEGSGLRNNYAICRSRLANGEYGKPELLPRSINLPPFQSWTPFIAPDESYLIFSSDRSGQIGGGDLYISFHDIKADAWSEPVNMGVPVNTRTQERLPGVSPDGKYLFFTRDNPPHSQDVFWVSAAIIEKLKAKTVQEQGVQTNAPQGKTR
jgi:ankyrin repeat protein